MGDAGRGSARGCGGREPSGAPQTAGAPSPAVAGAARCKPPVWLARVPGPEGQTAFFEKPPSGCYEVPLQSASTPRASGASVFWLLGMPGAHAALGVAPGSSLWAAAVETSARSSPLAFS